MYEVETLAYAGDKRFRLRTWAEGVHREVPVPGSLPPAPGDDSFRARGRDGCQRIHASPENRRVGSGCPVAHDVAR